jgi:DNA-binding NarL/FixJ family response regulator
MAKLNIFLADSHDVLRRGLRSLLSSHSGWFVCGETKSGLDAVRLVVDLKPDVVILDLDMPGLNGVDVTRQIKRKRPATGILIYTAFNEEDMTVKALMAGALGHVLKSDSEDTLIDAVTAVGRHLPFLSTKPAEILLKHMQKRGGLDETRILTFRERKIVQLLSDGKTNKDVSAHLHISVKTVEAHRSAIMRKLGFKSISELVRYAIRNGLTQL